MFYNKIYKSIKTGLQNALVIEPIDLSINYQKSNASTDFIPYAYRTVDMGIDILWTEYNLGAFPGDKPEDWYGDYYAWGEIINKEIYSKDNYDYIIQKNDGWTRMSKYDLKLKSLMPENDVVFQNLKAPFRMPSIGDYQKLYTNTTHDYIKNYNNINGLNGVLLTSKNNGNTLFFPAAGCYVEEKINHIGKSGFFWIKDIYPYDTNSAYDFFFNTALCVPNDSNKRWHGFSVRGVKDII